MKYWKYREDTNDRKHTNQRGTQVKRAVVGSFFALIIVAVVLTAIYLWRLYSATASSDVSVFFQGGTLTIIWDTTYEMDACRLFRYDEEAEKYVSCGQYQEGNIMMDAVEAGEEIKLRLQAVRNVKFMGQKMELAGFSRELAINPMEIEDITLYLSVDSKNKVASINWKKDKGSIYEVYLLDAYGRRQLYSETDKDAITLDFTKDFALPDRSVPVRVAVRAVRREKDYMLYSPISESVVISRTDLLENDLSLCWEQIEERQYRLSWQECHGNWYEVQQWSEEELRWISMDTFGWSDEMIYQTMHLPSNTQVRFRVITYDDEKEREQGKWKAEPSEITFHTGMSPLYCTIWPIVPLKITDMPQNGKVLGEVPAGQALCVLEENGSCFKILYMNCLGYIDSRFCMINLPEYMGDLCMYDITNSISSIFRVHGYVIPEITDSVVKGYENVYLDDGDYLVPYLYPCTVKLKQAALNAAMDGYSLRIYDAFRPNEATRYLYDTVEVLMDELVIEEGSEDEEEGDDDGDGEDDEADQMPDSEEIPEVIPIEALQSEEQLTDVGLDEGELADVLTTDVEQVDGEPLEEMYDTYRSIMTNDGRYHLASFLAASVSAHNRGIALDLVLVDANTKEDLVMQSEMHDLSWYSSIGQNNENARLLAKYMKDVGYNDLSSEWWHFQDDETRNQIGLNSYLTTGVSVEGWKKDDIGWKYRLKDGSFYEDKTVSIDGKECVFDVEGYCAMDDLVE